VNTDRAQTKETTLDASARRARTEGTSGGAAHPAEAHLVAVRSSTAIEVDERCERQVKTIKCTTSTTTSRAVHGIRGRSCSPGSRRKRGGLEGAARNEVVSEALPSAERGIKGRDIAPGAARGMHELGTRGDGAITDQEPTLGNVVNEGEMPSKRRRHGGDGDLSNTERHVVDAARPRPCTPGGSRWSSRRALLDSLRASVRPPEGPA
jgi:hypothetical protein